jgi:hypothetical protein
VALYHKVCEHEVKISKRHPLIRFFRDHSYGGADQWQLEGVQPGGVRSGGIYGLWTHCDHDEEGPIGPFCYFPQQLCEMRGKFREFETRRVAHRTIIIV